MTTGGGETVEPTRTEGFLRVGARSQPLPRLEPGDVMSVAEADAAAHRFFAALAGNRTVTSFDDPIDHVRENALLLLFDVEASDAFVTFLDRMPESRQEQWRDLIAGGASSEAFGPLTLQEQLDARQVEEALSAGRRQRTVNVVATALLVLVVVVVGVLAWRWLGPEPRRSQGALQFAAPQEAEGPASIEGGPPVAEPRLTVVLDEQVVVRAGNGSIDDRVVAEMVDFFPVAPGAVSASLFAYGGGGQVALVGPDGFADGVCFRVSVVTSDLRPLDTIRTGGCRDPIGRESTVTCAGPSATILGLTVPAGEVELPEGGSGFADGVRLQLIVDGGPEYAVATLRGTIAVDPDQAVPVPSFGGAVGDELVVDLGRGRTGNCTLLRAADYG